LRIKLKIKNEFLKNVLLLVTGSAIAQSIPILVSPVLSRLYTPEDFGILGLFTSLIMITAIVSTLRYETAILLPEKDEDAFAIVHLCLALQAAFSILTFIVILLFNNAIAKLLGASGLAPWLYLLPITALFSAFYQTLTSWLNRIKSYKTIASSKVAQTLTNSGIGLLLGFLGFTPAGLIIGRFGGWISASMILFKNDLMNFKKYKFKKQFKLIKLMALKYKDFPKYNLTIALVNIFSFMMPIFLLSSFFSPAIVGIYTFSYRLIKIPMGIVTESVAKVFLQKASSEFNQKGDTSQLVRMAYKNLFKLAIVPFTLLFFLAPILFEIVFGDNWSEAGRYTQAMTPWLFMNFLNRPISSLVSVLNKQKSLMYYQIFLLIARFLALYAGYKIFEDSYISIILFSIIGLLFNLYLLSYLLYISKRVSKADCTY